MASAAPPPSDGTAVAAPAAAGDWRCSNSVLRRLFPRCVPLVSFLAGRGFARSDLLRPDDPREYARLLQTTVVVELSAVAVEHAAPVASASARGGAQVLPPPPSANFDTVSLATWLVVPSCPTQPTPALWADRIGAVASTAAFSSVAAAGASVPPPSRSDGMRNLLLHAIQRLLGKGPNVSVLTQGYTKLDNHRNRSGVGDLYIHNTETNTVVTYLQTAPWCLLLQRTGDELVHWMITYTCMFAELQNDCFVQLTGPAVVRIHKAINLAKSQRPTSASTNHGHRPAPTTVAPSSSIALAASTPLARSHSLPPNSAAAPPLRTSSSLAAAVAAAATPARTAASLHGPSPRLASSISTRKMRSRSLAPKFMPLVTPLPRSTMFYRAPLRTEVGLPANHPFHLCPPSKRGAQRLIAHIYQLAPVAPPALATTSAATSLPVASPTRSASVSVRHETAQQSGRLVHPMEDVLSSTLPPLPSAARSTRLPPVPAFHAAPIASTTAPLAPPTAATATAFAINGAAPKKKRVRIKTDARKEKRRLQLLSAAGVAEADERKEAPLVAFSSVAPATAAPAAASSKAALVAAASSSVAPLPAPPLVALPPRLRALVPLMETLLRRHHRCYYGQWLHECCPWRLPPGHALPKSITPTGAQPPPPPAPEAEAEAMDCTPPLLLSASEDDGGVRPMSIDEPTPPRSIAAAAAAPSSSQSSLSFPSISSHLSSSVGVSPATPQHNRSCTRSPTLTPLSQAPSSARSGGSGCASSPDRRTYFTQDFEDKDEDESMAPPPAVVTRSAILAASLSSAVNSASASASASAVASPQTLSQSFQPPSIALNVASAGASISASQLSATSLHSTTSTDASAVALLQRLHESPVRASATETTPQTTPQITPIVARHAEVGCDPLSPSPAVSVSSSSIILSQAGSASLSLSLSSQLSSTQRRRAKWHERLQQKKEALRSQTFALVRRSSSSKQTQTPSRRAQAIYASAALKTEAASSSFMPLADLPVETLILMSASSAAVVDFLRCIVSRVLPSGLLGSSRNREIFVTNMVRFVRLRRFETITGQQLMEGMRVGEIEWLKREPTPSTTEAQSHSSRPHEVGTQVARPGFVKPRKRKVSCLVSEGVVAPLAAVSSTDPLVSSAAMPPPRRHPPKQRGKNRRGVRPPHKITPLSVGCASAESGANPLDAPDRASKRAKLSLDVRYASSSAPGRSKKQKPALPHHQPPSHHAAQVRLLSTLLRFLLTDLVLPLLRTNFYCTDTEASKHRIVYFRREVWNELVRKSMADLSGSGSGEGSHAGPEGDRAMFVRMDKTAAVSYLHRRLKDVTSTTQLPMAPLATATSTGPTSVLTAPPLRSSGAPMAASPSASTLAGFGLGVAKLRLRPRKNGAMRPIVNMARGGQLRLPAQAQEGGARPPVLCYPPINTVLRHLFEVLRYEKEESQPQPLPSSAAAVAMASYLASPTPSVDAPSGLPPTGASQKKKSSNIMGCSVFGINAIYARILAFAQQWKGLKPLGVVVSDGADIPKAPLYAVCVDVKHCFDTINRVKLMSILSGLLSERAYSLSRYTSLVPQFGVLRPKYLRAVAPAANIPMFLSECLRRSQTQRHAVYTDAVHRRFHDAPGLLATLHEHIYQNIVKLGSSYYHQTDGIPQGSVLSSLLCCIYLAHLEKRAVLPHLVKAANSALGIATKRARTSSTTTNQPHRSQSVQVGSTTTPSVSAPSSSKQQSPVKSASMIVRKRGREDATSNQGESQLEEAVAAKRLKFSEPRPASGTNFAHPAAATSVAGPSSSSSSSPPPSPLVFPPLHLLLRQMDDFLYVTTSLAAARKFHELMTRGFKHEYGMEINASKTKIWFGEEDARERANQPRAEGDPTVTREMAWNGYLLDVPTLALSADYTRLKSDRPPAPAASSAAVASATSAEASPVVRSVPVDRSSLADSLTIDSTRHRGLSLARSFRRFLHPRLHPLLLSSGLHSSVSVSSNLFANFAVSAAKLVAHSDVLAALANKGSPGNNNQWFLFRTMLDGIEYALNLVHARFRNLTPEGASASPAASSTSSASRPPSTPAARFPLSNLQFRALALHAYLLVFERKQTRYKLVYLMLRRLLHPTNGHALLRFEKTQPRVTSAAPPALVPAIPVASAPTSEMHPNVEMSAHDYDQTEAAPADALAASSTDGTSTSSASSSAWQSCLHRAMYALLQSERSQLTPSSAPLGIVPRPPGNSQGERDAALAKSTSCSAATKTKRRAQAKLRALARAAVVSKKNRQPRALLDLMPEGSLTVAGAPPGEAFELPLQPAILSPTTVSSTAPRPPRPASSSSCICDSAVCEAPATVALSFVERHQLRRVRSMLPHLESHARSVLCGLRF